MQPRSKNGAAMLRLQRLASHVSASEVASDEPSVVYSVANGVATIRMNEPQTANTFTPTLTAALSDAIGEAEADPEVRVLILTGTGRVFSADGNAVGMSGGGGPAKKPSGGGAPRRPRNPVASHALTESSIAASAAKTSIKLREMPKPTIAAV